MNAMHVDCGWINVHCVDRAGMAHTTTTKGLGIMSKLTIAELIGETPEMMLACGEAIQYEMGMRDSYLKAQQNAGTVERSFWVTLGDLQHDMHESAMANVARMVAAK